MDWPARLVIEMHGKSYVRLFVVDAYAWLQPLQEHLKLSIHDQIIVRGEGEEEDALVCRKSYLVQSSEYFRSFVERWNHDKATSIPEIKLGNISLAVFKNLIELDSTGLLEMGGHSNLSDLVGAANFLQMKDLYDRFSKFIRDEMKVYNMSVIMWCHFTPEEYHGLVGLSWEASKFLKSKFEFVLATFSEQLMDWSGKQWLDIISDSALFVVSEDLLFRTICRWVAVDPLRRSDDFVAMTQYIRGGCLSKILLDEFRDEKSIPSVVRIFVCGINESSESQPRTIDVVAFLPRYANNEMLCFDPLARFAGPISLDSKFDHVVYSTRGRWDLPANIVYLVGGDTLGAIDPVLNKCIQIPSFLHSRSRGDVESSTYLDGFLYTTSWSENYGRHFYKVVVLQGSTSCFDSDRLLQLDRPYHLCDRQHLSLIGLAGKIYVFFLDSWCTYDPSNNAWSAALPITLPFEVAPFSCCVGPDGMIYVIGYSTSLWIFNTATSECRRSAACTHQLREVLNVENKIICVVHSTTAEHGTQVYDHIQDSWSEFHETTVGSSHRGQYLTVRLLASSIPGLPRKSEKRPLEE